MQLDPKRYDVAVKQLQKMLSENEVIIQKQSTVIKETQEDICNFKKITAEEINAIVGEFEIIKSDIVSAETIYANYVRTDKANIDTAWIEDLLVQGNLLVDEFTGSVGNFTKYLTGVKIYGDIITAGTISTERLIIRDPETNTGILYEINNGTVDQTDLTKEELKRLTLDGKVITAESITADKIAANTITGDKILANSITANEIASDAITADKIKTGEVKTEHIDAKAITADKIDVKDLFAQEIESNGSIKGVTFIAEGSLSEEKADESMVDFVRFLGGIPTLTASGALMTMFAGLSENADHLKTEHSAFGSRYKVESEKDQSGDNLGLHTGYDEHILDVNSFGINFRARKAGTNTFTSLFKVDLGGAYWESSKLISQADLSKGVNGKISRADEAEKDGKGNVIADTYLPMKGGELEGDLHVKGNLSVDNHEQLLTELLGYTPSYIQIRTTADGPAWSTSYQHFYPYHETAAPTTWSNKKGNLTLDTNNVVFGDRETGVNSYGIRIGKNINMVRVHSNVTFSTDEELPSLVSATIYRWQKSTGEVLGFSQAWTHVEKNNGGYGTCTSEAIIAVQEGDFIFIGAYKGSASRNITTPAGNGRTNMIVEAIG